ncbi:MAG: glutamate synthase subunit beta [Bacteroidales bacterium]|nr:glutamate synthase subunit beta [Bacteroidales bacterium]
MGDYKGFLTIPRKEAGYRPVRDRIHDFGEVEQTLNESDRRLQASRCMDCGVPFCNWACPLGNRPPEWNDAVFKGDFERAYKLLNTTNDFPEFTGRVCPALCEKACVLNLTLHEPTTNRENEAAITEIAWRENFIQPVTPQRNGRKVAVIGAGPSGLAAANRLNRMGYSVSVYEKNEKAGGLLRFGIPNFKLNKLVIDRRIALMEAEGIQFHYNCSVTPDALPKGFDAYVLATGTPQARDLKVPGRELKGVHFALELLSEQNRVLYGADIPSEERVSCKDKDVLVIGGGDTGSDCIGTAHRQGCRSVTQIEILPKPPEGPDDPANPWPLWPRTLKTSSSHEEGCVRRWNINTLRFLGEEGRLSGVEIQPIDWVPDPDGGRPRMVPAGEPEVIKAQIVLLAMGFLKPDPPQVADNVFLAGDLRNGASLVVRAMASGHDAAAAVDRYFNEQSL